jgi:hypothetical protein
MGSVVGYLLCLIHYPERNLGVHWVRDIPEEIDMIKKVILASISITILLVCGGAVASTGNQLMDGIRANEKIDRGEVPIYAEAVSWGYLTGILRATSGIMTNTGGMCPTGNVSKGDLLEVTANWLNRHSDRLDDPDYVLVALALAEAYPCPAK